MSRTTMQEKIAAILRKAASTNSPKEAATFMTKARELMEKHQISLADLPTEGRKKNDPMGTDRTPAYQEGSPAETKHWLKGQVAHFYGCYIVVVPFRGTKGPRAFIDYHGPESARTTSEEMFPFIWKQVLRMAKENSGGSRKVQRTLQRDISRALSKRLRRIAQKRKAEGEVQTSSTALVILSGIEEATKDFAVNQYPGELREGKPRNFKPQSNPARRLAEEVALDSQINSGDATHPLIT